MRRRVRPNRALRVGIGGTVVVLVAAGLLSFRNATVSANFVVALLVAVAIVAVIARRDRASANAGRAEILRIHRVAEQVVTGDDPADVILSAEAELLALMDLAGCRFEAPPYATQPLVRLERGATKPESRWSRVTDGAFELPAEGAELQVLSRGQPLGRFILVPKPGTAFTLEQRIVAVALADQVGAALASPLLENNGRYLRHG